MYCTHKIIVSKLFSLHSLVTREVAMQLFEMINANPWYNVEVDFSSITFISRSFADQFHKEKIELFESHKKNIVCTNMATDVLAMFQAVSKTQNSHERNFQSFTHIHFENRRSLKDYLQSV